MGLKKILVSRSVVDRNHDGNERSPVFKVVDVDGNEQWANSVVVLGPSEIRYDPSGTVGNRVWIETYEKLVLKSVDSETGDRVLSAVI